MIAQLKGCVEQVTESSIFLNVAGVCYQVHVPGAIMKNLEGRLNLGQDLSLITYHYYQVDQSKSIPVLIGFSNRIEKEFFEKFITVSGVGAKAAVRALSMPIADIAQAIDAGDIKFMKSLPGLGEQKSKEIIAKLQGKMAKFGLMQDSSHSIRKPESLNLKEEALDVLLQLQYKKEEARQMVDKAFSRDHGLNTVEEVLSEVYKKKKVKA